MLTSPCASFHSCCAILDFDKVGNYYLLILISSIRWGDDLSKLGGSLFKIFCFLSLLAPFPVLCDIGTYVNIVAKEAFDCRYLITRGYHYAWNYVDLIEKKLPDRGVSMRNVFQRLCSLSFSGVLFEERLQILLRKLCNVYFSFFHTHNEMRSKPIDFFLHISRSEINKNRDRIEKNRNKTKHNRVLHTRSWFSFRCFQLPALLLNFFFYLWSIFEHRDSERKGMPLNNRQTAYTKCWWENWWETMKMTRHILRARL